MPRLFIQTFRTHLCISVNPADYFMQWCIMRIVRTKLSENSLEYSWSILYFLLGCLSNGSERHFSWLYVWCNDSDQKLVAVVTPIVVLPFFLFSGFFKNTGTISVWIGWTQYISIIKFGFQLWSDKLNLETSLWLSVLLLGVSFRMASLFFLWLLRSRLQWLGLINSYHYLNKKTYYHKRNWVWYMSIWIQSTHHIKNSSQRIIHLLHLN